MRGQDSTAAHTTKRRGVGDFDGNESLRLDVVIGKPTWLRYKMDGLRQQSKKKSSTLTTISDFIWWMACR